MIAGDTSKSYAEVAARSRRIAHMLIADGFGVHVPKGYIYCAMAFSAAVEALNMLSRRARERREGPPRMPVKR